jgi:hypothetical protein
MVALMAVPRNVRRPVQVLLVAAALSVAPTSPGFTQWLAAVLG